MGWGHPVCAPGEAERGRDRAGAGTELGSVAPLALPIQCSLLLIELASSENLQSLVPKIWRQRFFSEYCLFLLEQIRDGREEKELSEKVEMSSNKDRNSN